MQTKECIGCGFCCTKAICDAGMRIYSTNTPPCPALTWDGKRNVCKLMTLPGIIGEGYRKELYAGEGCCAGLNSWRREPLQDRQIQPVDGFKNPIPAIMQKFLKNLGRQFISGDVIVLTLYGFKSDLIKDGMSEDDAYVIVQECLRKIKNDRSSITSSFIGEIDDFNASVLEK